jgi:TM2 domain-containing membrane protein YozV/Tfp pilus assembly major pilin PilA
MTSEAIASHPIPTAGMISCGACKNTLHESAPICPHCGASQRSRGYKSKLTAGLLAILIGGFGVHRFYLGQWWGIFYLLLFWTAVPGLISIIEGIVFLVTNQESWDERHNEGKPNVGGEGSAGLVIALVVAVFGGIMVLGILAAIAIPAYQDYTVRARVAASMAAAEEVREAVEQHIIDQRAFPGSNADVGIAESSGDDTHHWFAVQEGGVVVMTYGSRSHVLAEKTLIFTPVIENNTIYWDCSGGTLEPKYRSAECR